MLYALKMDKNSMSLCFLSDGSPVDLGSTGRHDHRTQSPIFRCGLILSGLFMKARWIQPRLCSRTRSLVKILRIFTEAERGRVKDLYDSESKPVQVMCLQTESQISLFLQINILNHSNHLHVPPPITLQNENRYPLPC